MWLLKTWRLRWINFLWLWIRVAISKWASHFGRSNECPCLWFVLVFLCHLLRKKQCSYLQSYWIQFVFAVPLGFQILEGAFDHLIKARLKSNETHRFRKEWIYDAVCWCRDQVWRWTRTVWRQSDQLVNQPAIEETEKNRTEFGGTIVISVASPITWSKQQRITLL